jgi:uncharacterized protein
VNKPLPTREQAIELLRKNNCSPQVISHCQAVAEISLDIAKELEKKGLKLDLKLIEAGALLHDIGRSKTNAVDHGVIGAQIAQSEGLPPAVVDIIRTHVGGGFTAKEVAEFGWPKDVYTPLTLEEKVVSYADKLVDNSKRGRVPVEVEIKRLRAAGHNGAAERVRKLDEEITGLLGN